MSQPEDREAMDIGDKDTQWQLKSDSFACYF